MFVQDLITYKSYIEKGDTIALLYFCDGAHSIEDLVSLVEKSKINKELAQAFVNEVLKKHHNHLKFLSQPILPNQSHKLFQKQIEARNGNWIYYPMREETPFELFLTLTRLCNHRCNYCFQGDDHGRVEEINTETWLNVLDQAANLGIQCLTISGGEPILHPGFFEIVEYAHSLGMFIKLNTNGVLYTKETVNRLKQYELGFIQLSLPTVDEIHYNQITNSSGNLLKMKDAVKYMKEAGIFIRAKMVLTPINVLDAEKVMDFCYDTGIDQLHLAVFVLTQDGQQNLLPEEEDLKYIYKIGQERQKRFGNSIIIGGPSLDALHWKDKNCIVRCGGMKDMITILADGTITYCEPLVNLGFMKFGNVKTDLLADIWNSPIPDKANYPAEPCSECTNCEFYESCGGGCPMFSYLQSGSFGGVDARCWKNNTKPNLFEKRC